jgi:serine O-acetyltransferase
MSDQTSDPMWESICSEAKEDSEHAPIMASYLYSVILRHKRFEDALSFILASKLETGTISSALLLELFSEAMEGDANIGEAARADIKAVCDRDPACRGFSAPLLYFKGFHALQAYRVAHYFWQEDRAPLAQFLQSHVSETFGVDIHPAARIGRGVLMDHATSIVIGETAVVEDDVSMLHEVTLGGTGKETGDRHPKIRRGVLIGAGAKILGNVEVGEGAKVGAGSVVLEDVPPHCTAAGVPAVIVGKTKVDSPAHVMDHRLANGNADDTAKA